MKSRHCHFHRTLLTILMLLTIGISPALAAPFYEPEVTTIQVSPDGNDVVGCGSTSQPCQTIQFAINQAANGDVLKVATGTYTYNAANNPCTFLNTPAVACVYNKNLTIVGGYSSSNWDSYNPAQNLTVIEGQGQYRGVALIAATGNQAQLLMKGFTVQNGRAYGKDTSSDDYVRHAFGAGVYANHGLLTLEDLVVKNNAAYGGSSTSISIGGWAFGGGVAVEGPIYGGGTTSFTNVTIQGNQAVGGTGKNGGGNGMGGGFMTNDAILLVNGLTISNNIARGGNTAGNGCNGSGSGYGGAASLGNDPSIVINHMVATNNQAYGGNASGSASCGGYGIGAGIFLESATVQVNDSMLNLNQAFGGVGKNGGIGWAGGIYSDKVNLVLERVKLVANSAQSGGSSGGGSAGQAGGGAAYFAAFDGNDYHVSITNSLVADNKAIMGSPGTKNTGGGGGFFIQALPVDIIHSTFANNQLENGLDNGQAIIVVALNGTSGKAGSANLRYSVFTDHKNNYTCSNAAVTVLQGSVASLYYDWFGNNTNDYIVPSGTPVDHVWQDERSGGYVAPSAPEYDFHLKAESPVINLASGSTLTTDLDFKARPVFNVSDLGAYEFSIPALIANHTNISTITDKNQTITVIIHISATCGENIEWIADTNADWIALGSSGSGNQASGETESDLLVTIDTSKVDLGLNSATISVTSASADPVTITVQLTKMENLYELYAPVIVRH